MILVNNNCNNKESNADYYGTVTAVIANNSFNSSGNSLFSSSDNSSFDDNSFGPSDDDDSFDSSNDSSSFSIFIPFNNDETTGSKINLKSYDEEFGEEEWGNNKNSG